MELTSKKVIQELLKKHQTIALKRLGQNFLTNKGVINKIIETAELSPEDIILEIGPGLGVLTWELAKKSKRVIAVEKDPKLVAILNNELKTKQIGNLEIIQGDIRIRKSDTQEQRRVEKRFLSSTTQKYKIVANLPFYLTAAVIRQFLESENPPEEMVLLMQKEVAQRICAKVPDMNLLAVSVQFYGQPKIISYISKKSFWPSPKVDAAIIKISAINQRRKSAFNQRFFKIVRVGFSQPRKQLINNLSKGLKLNRVKVDGWLKNNNIQPTQRAETLAIKDWINLTKTLE